MKTVCFRRMNMWLEFGLITNFSNIQNIMISPEKAKKFMWFCAGIVLSMSALYFLQKFFDF